MINKVIFILGLWFVAVCYAEETEINLYRPFAHTNKHAEPTIVLMQKGVCFQQSNKIKREDAWRCRDINNKIFDPCFTEEYESHGKLVCPNSPWDAKSVELHVAHALDNSSFIPLDISKSLPWAIQLKTGEHCIFIESSQTVHGIPVHYQCEKNTQLLGELARCNPLWSIAVFNGNDLGRVEIAIAWY